MKLYMCITHFIKQYTKMYLIRRSSFHEMNSFYSGLQNILQLQYSRLALGATSWVPTVSSCHCSCTVIICSNVTLLGKAGSMVSARSRPCA
ncbi:hypothetical protein FKM82_013576 [Ascaphus truei]